MRILLVNHGSAGEWGGGDAVQIRETGKLLGQRGHEVVGNSDQPDCRSFDLVHLFNCRVDPFISNGQLQGCGSANCCFPIWISRFVQSGEAAATGLLKAVKQGEAAAEPLLEQLRRSWW